MSSQPTAYFELLKPEEWISAMANQFDGDLNPHGVVFNNDILRGEINYQKLEEGLYFTYIAIHLQQQIKLERRGTDKNDVFILNFYKSNVRQIIENEVMDFGYNSPYGVFFTSTHTDAQLHFPSGPEVSVANIAFSRSWLEENVLQGLDASHGLLQAIHRNKAVLLYESYNIDFEKALIDIFANNHLSPALRTLFMRSKVTELVGMFFEKIFKRTENEFIARIHPGDQEAILQVRLSVLKDLSSRPPKVEELAEQVAMSTSKLKRLFKHIYGESIYNYFIKARMQKAKELLSSGNYIVSDVAFMVGYSNLGQFSKIFKREMGLLPKQLLVQR